MYHWLNINHHSLSCLDCFNSWQLANSRSLLKCSMGRVGFEKERERMEEWLASNDTHLDTHTPANRWTEASYTNTQTHTSQTHTHPHSTHPCCHRLPFRTLGLLLKISIANLIKPKSSTEYPNLPSIGHYRILELKGSFLIVYSELFVKVLFTAAES